MLEAALDELRADHSAQQLQVISENSKVKSLTAELDSIKSLLASASDESSSVREENCYLMAEIDSLKVCARGEAQAWWELGWSGVGACDAVEMSHCSVVVVQHP
jgi:hypothetical protein